MTFFGNEQVLVQIYTWVDPVTDKVYHFNATAMLDDVLAKRAVGGELAKFVLQAEHVAIIIRDRGVDLAYARSLSIEKLKQPIIAIYNAADDTTLTVDGHHRYVRWFELGIKEGMMYRFSDPASWRQYIMDLPPEIAQSFIDDVRKVPLNEVPADQKPFTIDE